MIGERARLFLVSVIVILLVGLASGSWLEHELSLWIGDREHDNLQHDAATAVLVVDQAPVLDAALAARIAEATGTRVTIEASDGRVLAESSPAVPGEILSNTAPFHRADVDGVVRTSVPVGQPDAVSDRVRVLVGVAGLLGFFVAVVISWVASEVLSRRLRELADSARKRVGRGRPDLAMQSVDEIHGLAGSFDRLATDLDHTVDLLAAERDRLGALVEGMSEGVFSVDAQGRIGLVNAAALAMLRREGKDPRGGPLTLLTEDPALHELVDAARRGEAAAGELDRNGRFLLVRAGPAAGGCVVVMFDVTDLRRLERIRRDFVANVSHELRTPVAIILANAETLQDGAIDDPKQGPRFVEAIHRNAERLARLIADLLDLSRIEAGRYPLDLRAVNAGAAARHAIDMVRSKADQHVLDVQIDPNLSVQADGKALEQVLVNLVDNAVKYTPAGGSVVLRAIEAEGRITLQVVDDGPGIPLEHRERIFERFYRVDPGRSRDMGGTGLGLAIVRHLVEAMGGRVAIRPNEPKGSIFEIELPRAA